MIYWITHITLLGILSYLAFRYSKSDYPTFLYWVALTLKLSAGIVLGLIFHQYYGGGDTITFFELAKNYTSEEVEDQPRTQFFITLIRPLVQLSGESYWIVSLWISFLSFLATWNAVLILSRLYPNIKIHVATCLLLIPSVVFWSSGVMKDAIAFASLVTIVSIVLKIHNSAKLTLVDLILAALSMFLLLKIKHYLLIVVLIFSGILIANLVLTKIGGKFKWLIAVTSLVIIFGATQLIHPYLKIDRLAWTIHQNNLAIHQKSEGNSLDIVIADDSWTSVLKELPAALHAGLFRPSILDETPPWGWLHKLENLILAALIFLSLLLVKRLKPKIDKPLFIAALISILLLAAILPLSTPNFGSLVRYKIAYIPFLFLFSSILPYQFFNSKSGE